MVDQKQREIAGSRHPSTARRHYLSAAFSRVVTESIPPVMTLLAVHLHSNSKRLITLHNEQAFLDQFLFPILYLSLFRNTLNRRKGSTILRSSVFSLVNLLRVNELATDTITMSSNPAP